MVQAARSGRLNIAQGCRASGNSSQTELRLVGVARASLDELLLDYEDFLRQRRLPMWERLAAARIAERARTSDRQQDSTEGTSAALRVCPKCGKPMVLRTARNGANAGTRFWGCAGYPACKGTRVADGRDQIDCCDDGRGKP